MTDGVLPTLPLHQRSLSGSSTGSPRGNLLTQCIPEELTNADGMTKTSVNSNPLHSNNDPLCLEEQPWFWADVDRDEVTEHMRLQPDGTFLVRNSTTPGDYTLTLRKDGGNKLIKIYCRETKYGFSLSEPLRFLSVVSLVEFYRSNSLREYNRSLDVRLLKPLPRPGSNTAEDEDCYAFSIDQLKRKLCEWHREYLVKSRNYDVMYEEVSTVTVQLRKHKDALKAYRDTQSLFEEQHALLKRNEMYIPDKDKQQVVENLELQSRRCESLQQHSRKLEAEIERLTQAHKQLERDMNSIKPKLLWLYKRRDRCMRLMQRRGFTQNDLNKLMKDEVEKAKRLGQQLEAAALTEERTSPEAAQRPGHWAALVGEVAWPKESWLMDVSCGKPHAVQLLTSRVDGTFLIRPSSKQGCYALSISCSGHVFHCLIEPSERGIGFKDTGLLFPSLNDFVSYYRNVSLLDHNPDLDTKLCVPVKL